MEQPNQEIGTRKDLVLYRLETARNDLRSARALLAIEDYKGANNTSGDIPIATYKDGKMKKEIEYILVETKAPEGYVRSEKEENVVFEYKDDKTKEIEITKELTNERIPTGGYVKSPKTGDDTNIWLPILLLVLSVGGIAGIFWYTKKKNHEE